MSRLNSFARHSPSRERPNANVISKDCAKPVYRNESQRNLARCRIRLSKPIQTVTFEIVVDRLDKHLLIGLVEIKP